MNKDTQKLVVHPRHWMHIWKVGFRRCASCSRDSRVIATLIDDTGKTIEQTMYCEAHAPTGDSSVGANDIESQLKFGLGFSGQITPDDDQSESEEIVNKEQ
jgi:hypothetical protein